MLRQDENVLVPGAIQSDFLTFSWIYPLHASRAAFRLWTFFLTFSGGALCENAKLKERKRKKYIRMKKRWRTQRERRRRCQFGKTTNFKSFSWWRQTSVSKQKHAISSFTSCLDSNILDLNPQPLSWNFLKLSCWPEESLAAFFICIMSRPNFPDLMSESSFSVSVWCDIWQQRPFTLTWNSSFVQSSLEYINTSCPYLSWRLPCKPQEQTSKSYTFK